jgi:pantothenate kinase-related protein Tda10
MFCSVFPFCCRRKGESLCLAQQRSLSSVDSVVAPYDLQKLNGDLYCPIRDFMGSLPRELDRPLLIGISAPQGCGKTTLTNQMVKLFDEQNLRCVSMSLDDFYLTAQEQTSLAEKYRGNALLKYRGNGKWSQSFPASITYVSFSRQP